MCWPFVELKIEDYAPRPVTPQPRMRRKYHAAPYPAQVYPHQVYPNYYAGPGGYYQYSPDYEVKPPLAADDDSKEHVWYYVPAGEQSNTTEGIGNDGDRVHHRWNGRTSNQVNIENEHMATAAVVEDHAIAPRDPKPDSLFWVVNENGSRMLLDINTINAAMQPGKWVKDGKTMYFQRTK